MLEVLGVKCPIILPPSWLCCTLLSLTHDTMTLVLALLATSLPLSTPVLVLDSEADLTQELLVRWCQF